MNRIPQVTNPSDPFLVGVYQDICEVTGSPAPASLYTAMAVRPDLVAATWDLVKVLFVEGQLPPVVTQFMVTAMSIEAGCRYCEVAHSQALESLGIEKNTVQRCLANLDDMAVSDLHRAIISFSVKASKDPTSITDADVDHLRSLGISDEELVEVAIVVALTKLLNTWADTVALPIEGQN